jgi:hypothetical protein
MQHTIQLKENVYSSIPKRQELLQTLRYHENKIRADLAQIRECSFYIGLHLLDIEMKELYKQVHLNGSYGDYCKNIYQYTLQELDLCKTTTHNLMTVATVFRDYGSLKKGYENYSFSQLVELSTVPSRLHQYASPYMTIKQFRAWKRGERISISNKEKLDNSIPSGEWCQIPPEEFAALLPPPDVEVKEIQTSELQEPAETTSNKIQTSEFLEPVQPNTQEQYFVNNNSDFDIEVVPDPNQTTAPAPSSAPTASVSMPTTQAESNTPAKANLNLDEYQYSPIEEELMDCVRLTLSDFFPNMDVYSRQTILSKIYYLMNQKFQNGELDDARETRRNTGLTD